MTTIPKQKVTIALEKPVYDGLVEKVGKRKIGSYLSQIARPYVVTSDLDAAYAAMTADEVHEREESEWMNAPIDTNIE